MNIALIGYGRMGHEIEELAIKRHHNIVCKISSKNLMEFNPRVLQWADVAIEFSTPEAAFNNIAQCMEIGLPVVSGTTGWLNKMDEMHQLCKVKNGTFLYASNFSIGVNIFFEINRKLAQIMNNYEVYDLSVQETHHTSKLDRPSGTAISLANDIIEKIERKKVWTITEPEITDTRSLYIDSIRMDPCPGTHVVKYSSEIDDIEIKHEAHSRKGFANGALLAAEWLVGKKGIYNMQDVLKI